MPLRASLPVKISASVAVSSTYVVPPEMLPLPLPPEVRLTYTATSPFHWLPLRRARRLHAPGALKMVSELTPEMLSNCDCKSLPAPDTRFAGVMDATQSPLEVRSA